MSLTPVALRSAGVAMLFAALAAGCMDGNVPTAASSKSTAVFEGPVPTATCGPGSDPETGLQGQVTLVDRISGRSTIGYRCNLELTGQYQGRGTSWVSASYDHCAYLPQTTTSLLTDTPGVLVLDVSDPAHPQLTARLTSPAFLGNPWESLKVNTERGLLAGVQSINEGTVFFDVYDIKEDCAHPRLLNSIAGTQLSLPANTLGHEGNWSADGMTYWSTSAIGGIVTAIDVSNPALPRIAFIGQSGLINHGFELSDDGNRLYLAQTQPQGLYILDVSEIQARKPLAQLHPLGSLTWTDGAAGQHAIPVTWAGKPYVIFVDEGGAGAARIIDISDETAPRIVSKLKLEIHMPENANTRATDTAGTGGFGYEAHYCEADRKQDPTALACGYFQSGIRVFDIRDPTQPREIAYFNPPAQLGKNNQLLGSEHANGPWNLGSAPNELSADWCSSPPRFVTQADGEQQLWVTCQDNGFMVLKFTNGAYPIKDAPANADSGAAASPRFGGALALQALLLLALAGSIRTQRRTIR